jgi:hypothetical protein
LLVLKFWSVLKSRGLKKLRIFLNKIKSERFNNFFKKKMDFDSLPRNLKEEIWSNLSEEEFFSARTVSKNWKTNIENARSSLLKESVKNSFHKSRNHLDGKTFYKDFDFTSKILAFSDFKVGLNCFYGKVFGATQLCLSMTCFFFGMFQIYKKDYNSIKEGLEKDENCCCNCCIYSLAFPFALISSIFLILVEFLRILFWLLTVFHCCRSKNFNFTNAKGLYLIGFEGKKIKPPFESKEELLNKFQTDHNSLVAHVTSVEEKLSFGSCCAILLFGVSSCKI